MLTRPYQGRNISNLVVTMAPTIGSPITQISDTSSRRSRPVIPIIPAIPRSLERKPKRARSVQKVQEEAVTPVAPEVQQCTEKELPAVSAPEAQNGVLSEDGGQVIPEDVVERTTDIELGGKKALSYAATI